MNDALFPQRRADGSFSVAARFRISDGGTLQAFQKSIDEWVQVKRHQDGIDVSTELAGAPSVELVDSQTVQIVLHCRSSSKLWKGLLVEIVKQVRTFDGVAFIGFWDVVTGRAHPASVERS
jgi:hypothetical protein